MRFNYQARTKTGEIQSGIIEASSKEAAINLLRSHNFYVTILEEEVPPFYAKKIRLFKRISKKEIVAFSRQLSIMFKAEIPLIEILETLNKQTQNPFLKEKILDMIEKVEGGTSLSKTFSFYPELFSPFYINMIKSGEASGTLSDVFIYLADHLEREYHFQRKIKGVLIYPAFVLFVFFGLLFVMIFFVMPQLVQFLTEAGAELPTITKIVIGFTNFLRQWALILILALLFLIIFLSYYLKTKEGKIFFEKNLLKLPFLSDFLKKIYLSRLALNLSTLISGGLPITQALEITGQIVGNEVYKKIILNTSEGVKRGEPISSLLERYPQEISPLFIQMTVVGEKTGRLNSSLMNIVDFYQKEIDRTVDNFANILEPVLIIFLGLIVAVLMVTVILPLYQLVTVF